MFHFRILENTCWLPPSGLTTGLVLMSGSHHFTSLTLICFGSPKASESSRPGAPAQGTAKRQGDLWNQAGAQSLTDNVATSSSALPVVQC